MIKDIFSLASELRTGLSDLKEIARTTQTIRCISQDVRDGILLLRTVRKAIENPPKEEPRPYEMLLEVETAPYSTGHEVVKPGLGKILTFNPLSVVEQMVDVDYPHGYSEPIRFLRVTVPSRAAIVAVSGAPGALSVTTSSYVYRWFGDHSWRPGERFQFVVRLLRG